MHISMPDPHPGRCQNVRPSKDANGYPTWKRCLDYEGTPHTCSFPEDPPRVSGDWGGHTISMAPREPKPWVKP